MQHTKRMSSPYPILNNRQIDQWKVTELREELRRRKLKTNGLKEDLVRRLDGALRAEMEEPEKEELGNGSGSDNDPIDNIGQDDPVHEVNEEESAPVPAENNAEPVEHKVEHQQNSAHPPEENSAEPVEDGSNQAVIDAVMVGSIGTTVDVNQGTKDQDQKEMGHTSLDAAVEDTTKNAVPFGNSVTDSQIGVVQLESGDQGPRYDEKNEDSKPSAEDAAFTVSEPTNQVPEVSTDLGFQVKSESISTDSVSINEKNELKDNLNANNVHLELEVVKPEMVQPSSSDVPTTGGDSDPLKDDNELVNQAPLEEAGDVTCATDMELCKKIEGVDGGSPEKLNLDRSSGEESMEDDVLESKQIESMNNSDEGKRKEDIKEDIAEVANPIDVVVGRFSPEKKDMLSEEANKPTTAAEKRKAEGTASYTQ